MWVHPIQWRPKEWAVKEFTQDRAKWIEVYLIHCKEARQDSKGKTDCQEAVVGGIVKGQGEEVGGGRDFSFSGTCAWL